MGIDRVMLGLDMMNYLSDFDNANLDDLQSHADCLKIEQELYNQGFNKEDVEKITYKNYENLKRKVGK